MKTLENCKVKKWIYNWTNRQGAEVGT